MVMGIKIYGRPGTCFRTLKLATKTCFIWSWCPNISALARLPFVCHLPSKVCESPRCSHSRSAGTSEQVDDQAWRASGCLGFWQGWVRNGGFLQNSDPCSVILFCIILYIILYYIIYILSHILLYYILCHIILHYILCHIILYYIILYFITIFV